MVKDGFPFVLPLAALTLLALFTAFRTGKPLVWTIAALLFLLTFFFAYFFRDPQRETPTGENLIVSPADGEVVAVEKVFEPLFLNGQSQKISIFLSPLDVHINRIPASGKVEYLSYFPGKFLAAYQDKASAENEQTAIGILTLNGKILFKQIAGVLARRIVCRLKLGQEVQIGEKFGMIKFGSRVDIFLPEGLELKLKKGDRVTGGETIIARAKISAPMIGATVEMGSQTPSKVEELKK